MKLTKSINFLLTLNVGKENNMLYRFIFKLIQYLKYQFNASNGKGHGIHSPFVYNFIRQVLNSKNNFSETSTINKYEALVQRIIGYYQPALVMEYEAFSKDEILHNINTTDKIGLLYLKQISNAEQCNEYFKILVQKVNSQSIVIFDNIHNTKQIQMFWENIKLNASVRLTIDVFKLGIIFFREEQLEKENFIIRF